MASNFCFEMLSAFDRLGIDYLTLLETKDNEYYVEGYVVNVNPSMPNALKEQINAIVKKCGLSIKETNDGVVVVFKSTPA